MQGSHVVEVLLEHKDKFEVVALTRNPKSAAADALQKKGCTVRRADLTDPESLKAAFKDCYGVYIVTQYWEAPKHEVAHGKAGIDAAKAVGVKHIVFGSAGQVDEKGAPPFFLNKCEIEKYLKKVAEESKIRYTILRPVTYYENWSGGRAKPTKGSVKGLGKPEKVQQFVALYDLGVMARLAFEGHEELVNGTPLELASWEGDGKAIAAAWTKVMGYKWEYGQVPPIIFKLFKKEMAVFQTWLDTAGYHANIERCRKIHPGLLSLEDWLRKYDWPKQQLGGGGCAIL